MPQHAMPRYRGFNLLDLFSTSSRWDDHFPMSGGAFSERDIQWISQWGFNFVRIPMSYLHLIGSADRKTFSESRLVHLDRLIEMGKQYGIHICLSFHRVPGYCVTRYPLDAQEIGNLWTEAESQELFKLYWSTLAERYKGFDGTHLSFNLVNEPLIVLDKRNPAVDQQLTLTWEEYIHVHSQAIEAIRAIDPDRTVIIDGANAGCTPCEPMAGIDNLVQSCRGYHPPMLTHYRCPWIGGSEMADEPTWPLQGSTGAMGTSPLAGLMGLDGVWDKERMRQFYKPWFDLADSGTAVHIGECGCYKNTQHKVVLQWFEDFLSLMKEQNIGYALWNFRGPFGVLDSERCDVAYEDWHGHKLDRELLTLLQKY
ncbi:glycoside hydrolase family 5 protein [Anaerocolumna jejuensis]|uniref:glycoside hydrolase family 5 protein n=1 Tax=Anaerocolumna jejuensis TaxID=259063 RepID=UPI003F7B687D